MNETYGEVLYHAKRGVYINIDIDYSKIDGETLEGKINKIKEQCKKKGLFYCQRGITKDRFVLPVGCEATLLPTHANIIRLSASDDFIDFINERNEKNLNNIWFRSDEEIRVMKKSEDTLKTQNLNQKNNKGYLSRAEKKKLKKNILV